GAGAGCDAGLFPAYMLPASTSAGGEGNGLGVSLRPARKRSTIAAISSRPIFAAGAAVAPIGCCAGGAFGAAVGEAATAGLALLTGRTSKATGVMAMR